MGVASGEPLPGGVTLWTRLEVSSRTIGPALRPAQNIACTLEVFTDEALTRRVQLLNVTAVAAAAHSVHVTLTGLQPSRYYFYRFQSGDAFSTVGRTRTAPSPGDMPPKLQLALASCQHYEQGYFAAHRDMAAQTLDSVVFVGDYIYESGSSAYQIRKHTGGVPKTLEEYRARHALYKSDPDLQACHAAHPWLLTWDDHEVVNDYANDRDQAYTEPQVFLKRRAAAYRAYFEHMPITLNPLHPTQIYRSFEFGQMAKLWLLDNRQYRSHHACADPVRGGGRVVTGCDALQDPSRSMLGAVQYEWLSKGLAAVGGKNSTSSAGRKPVWKLIAQATKMSPSYVPTPLGQGTHNDAWDGYPLERQRLLQRLVDDQVKNAVVLGGDVHMNVLAQLRPEPNVAQSPVAAHEVVTTSITSRGLSPALLGRVLTANPDMQHAQSNERGYTLLTLTEKTLRTEMRTTPHPVRQADAAFSVQRVQLLRAE